MVRKLYSGLWRGAREKWYYGPGCCTSTRRKGSSGLASQQPSAGPGGPRTGSVVVRQKSGSPARIFLSRFRVSGFRRCTAAPHTNAATRARRLYMKGEYCGAASRATLPEAYLNRYWRYMLALSSTSASVTWVRPLDATLSSIRLRIKRRIRNGLRLILRSASGSQVISVVSAMHTLLG